MGKLQTTWTLIGSADIRDLKCDPDVMRWVPLALGSPTCGVCIRARIVLLLKLREMDGTDLTDADIVCIVARETSVRELSDAAFKTVDRYHTLLQAADPNITFIPTEVMEDIRREHAWGVGILEQLKLDATRVKKLDRDD